MRLRTVSDINHLPALDPAYAHRNPAEGLGPLDHKPRILLLYGSLREHSYSRFSVEEAARNSRVLRRGDPYSTLRPAAARPGQGDNHPAVQGAP